MPGSSPTVRRRRLANELRRLREAADLTIEDVAAALECSGSKVSRIETARVGATPRDVRDMLTLYKVDNAERDMLMRIAREARQRGWWHPYADLAVTTLVGLEAAATSLRVYTALLIPGLLQTESYGRAVLAAVLPNQHGEDIERRLRLRMERQERLIRDDPPAVWAVIDEAALRRTVGGPEAMREQVEHLLKLADLPTVTLQALPLAAGEHAGMDGDFEIIGFPEHGDPDVVYLESTLRDTYLEDIDDVRHYALLFDHLRAAALRPADSKSFFASVAQDLRRS